MQRGFHHDAPEVAWALLELLDAVGAEAELELLATVVEVVEPVELALEVALDAVVGVLAVVVDDVLALLADDVLSPAEVLPALWVWAARAAKRPTPANAPPATRPVRRRERRSHASRS
jgi:hypothetical protein